MLHLKLLEKQEQAKPKTSRSRKVIKIRLQLMKQRPKKKKKLYKGSTKQKADSFKKINIRLTSPWQI
jgi:hypothetical protein